MPPSSFRRGWALLSFEKDGRVEATARLGGATCPKPWGPCPKPRAGTAPVNDDGVVDESLIYVAHREFDDERMSRDDKQLYVLGLKAMLQVG